MKMINAAPDQAPSWGKLHDSIFIDVRLLRVYIIITDLLLLLLLSFDSLLFLYMYASVNKPLYEPEITK